MLLNTAHKWATDIYEQLLPYCSDIAIAGSIRRQCGLCDDIDMVCLVTETQRLKVRARCLHSQPEVRQDGGQILSIVLNNGVRVQINYAKTAQRELFNTTPSNWGSLLLCRTGPKEFNQAICIRAAEYGYRWDPFRGIFKDDQIIASETEQDIFTALHLDYIEPEHRKHIHLKDIAA